jgi:hypothetical protein
MMLDSVSKKNVKENVCSVSHFLALYCHYYHTCVHIITKTYMLYEKRSFFPSTHLPPLAALAANS